MTALVEMRNIVKVYPNGVVANDGTHFSVMRADIHALVGENGAGKSTLMKILYGMELPSSGEILLDGKKVRFHSAHDAIAAGIGMVHQNFMLVPSFSVAENIVLGQEPLRRGLVDQKRAEEISNELANQYGLKVDPKACVANLSVGMRQRVEILKTLYRGAQVLILDEPTAVLTPQETQDLFRAARTLIEQGKTIIFISHKLNEVKEIASYITVMRAGKTLGTFESASTTHKELARMMVGRDVLLETNRSSSERSAKVLEVKNLVCTSDSGNPILRNLSFNIYSGEILGIAGVEGNGQTELAEVLSGLRPAASGNALLHGKKILNQTPRRVREMGVAHIPEDRLKNGLALNVSVEENFIVDRYFHNPYRRGLGIQYKQVRALGKRLIDAYGIHTSSGAQMVSSLSGGNMQKVILAREFSAEPRLLIAAQPTRGVDVGSTEFIHARLIEQRSKGAAILLISADLSEVIKLADRILVLYEGENVGIFSDPARLTEETLGLYMLGIQKQTPEEMEAVL